jgi:hypothetical protein
MQFFLDCLAFEDGTTGCPETSVTSYKSALCNIPEELRESLKSSSKLGNFPHISAVMTLWARGVLVSWGTALQAERPLVRFPIVSLEFFFDIILPAALWSFGSAQPLTEMITRNISWGFKAASAYACWPYHLHLPTVWNLRVSAFWNSQDLSRDCFTFYHGAVLTHGDRIFQTIMFYSLESLPLITYSVDNAIRNGTF